MSTYSIGTLLTLWKQDQITTEQAVGYTLQQLATLTERVTELEKRCRRLEQALPESTGSRPS